MISRISVYGSLFLSISSSTAVSSRPSCSNRSRMTRKSSACIIRKCFRHEFADAFSKKHAGIEQVFAVRLYGEPQLLYADIFDGNRLIDRSSPAGSLIWASISACEQTSLQS